MSHRQLTGEQMDAYERFLQRVMIASAVALLAALFGVYMFKSGGIELILCGMVAGVSVIVNVIASTKLRNLERGITESDRGRRAEVDSALDGLSD